MWAYSSNGALCSKIMYEYVQHVLPILECSFFMRGFILMMVLGSGRAVFDSGSIDYQGFCVFF